MTPEELHKKVLRSKIRLVNPDIPLNTCCICGKQFSALGNNPEPYMPMGEYGENVCCDECNEKYVTPARVKEANTVDSEVESLEIIDEGNGDPNICYTYKCPNCHHMMKSHIFHMASPICSKCGTKTKHAETERLSPYRYHSREWTDLENEFLHDYNLWFDLKVNQEDWTEDAIDYVTCCTVAGRRGVRIFFYDAEGVPLSIRFYYDNRTMLQELLDR